MAAFNHRFHHLGDRGHAWKYCAHCRGAYNERPLAVIIKAYNYRTKQSARVCKAERAICEEHARKFAELHGLEHQLKAMLEAQT